MTAIISSTHDPKNDINCEVWRDILGLEGQYQVSNYGKVRSLDRTLINIKGRKKTYKGRLRAFTVNPNGYLVLSIKDKTYFVHVEVAKAFIPNPDHKKEVNHLDGKKLNCHVSNLEWATRLENIAHAFQNGLIVTSRGEKQSSTKLTTEIVLNVISSKETTRALGAKYGVGHSAIVAIRTGKTWNHITGLPRHKSINNKFIK